MKSDRSPSRDLGSGAHDRNSESGIRGSCKQPTSFDSGANHFVPQNLDSGPSTRTPDSGPRTPKSGLFLY